MIKSQKGKGRRPGKYVKHEDGRTGFIYNDDQLKEITNKGKVVVRFEDNLDQSRAVLPERLKVLGFVD